MEGGEALGREVARLGPVVKVCGQPVVSVENTDELFVAGQRLEVRQMTGIRTFRQRRIAARTLRQLVELVQQLAGGLSFFVWLTGDPGRLKQLAQLEALSGVDGRAFDPEVGAGHLRLIQLRRLERHAVCSGPQMSGSEQADERCVNGVPRPTIGRVGEVRPHVFAFFAGTHVGQHGGAHRVLLGLAAVVQGLQRMLGTLAGTFNYLLPTMIIGVAKLVEESG